MLLGNASSQARIRITAEDRTAAGLNSVQRNLGGVGAAARNVAGLIAGIGSAAAIASLTSLVRNTANYADQMSKLALRAGVTTEAISALAFAARLNDVDNNTLARGLRELGKDAEDGGKKLAELGIAITDAGGKAKTSDALLLEFADVIASIEEPAKRAAAASKLLGERAGPELIPLLAGGSAALRSAAEEASRFGKVVTEEAAASAVLFNDNMTRLTEASSGLAQQLAGPVISSLANASTYFLAVAKDVGFAEAALISFGGAVARTLGVDNVGELQSQARANSNAIALTVKQIETFQKLADRGVSGAAERVAKLREQYTALQRTGGGITDALKQEANILLAPAPGPNRRDAPDLSGLLGSAPAASNGAAARVSANKKTEEDFQVFLRGFDNASFDYKANLNSKLLSEKEQQEADHQDFLRGFDDARYDYLADRNEKRLQAEADAARANELAIQDFSQTLYGDVKGALSDAFRDTKDPIRAFGDALANVVFTRVSSGLATSIADGLLGKAGVGGGILGGLASKLFSFDGGGYTGAGPRSGGMDGRGGFMAMVHPNETVVDHTKGQRAGGQSVVINISNNIGDVSSKGDVVAGMQTVRAQILGELQRSSRYGGAMA
jgi:hypothetical protein